ncbi:MAG: hypothetical protein A3G04_02900 [Candidatus Taylorbacteria bacterium RIFCSPLOWO2_12_FULL_44_9]|nr:MAG: hypothetical protein A3G04_02900 [Candidatus Taylorbacteria bacterium RIFCSPLOWO2_12_FULL_44_9]
MRKRINLPDFILKYKIAIAAILVLSLIFCAGVIVASIPPSSFPRNVIVRIDKDMTVSEAALILEEKGIIKSDFFYKIYIRLLHNGKGVQTGSYLFDEPQSALKVAYRTAYGVKNIEKIRLTIFEGMNSKELAALLKKNLPMFDVVNFLVQAKADEGYLFPETYFIDPDVEPSEVIGMMRRQFDVMVKPLKEGFATSTRSVKDIIIMASILEKEANNMTDRKIISGILWKRLDQGMALQIDVPFYYILNKGSNPLTLDDLATPSPYNTYLNKGLPPTPIANPGLDSIIAALYPTQTPHYFYLADKEGITHYAVTHDEHVANKLKYLK